MRKLLLITGDLATGKSTFANILSMRYSENVFYKDTIKEILGDTVGFSNRKENLRLSKAAVELMLLICSEFSNHDKNLILEANFHQIELEKLRKIVSEKDYQVLTLVLRGDLHILHKRYLNRIYCENRHSVHLSMPLDDFDAFRDYIETARKEDIVGDYIKINADDFSYQKDPLLLSKIDAFMKE